METEITPLSDHQQARTIRLCRGDGHRRGHARGVVPAAVDRSTCCNGGAAATRRDKSHGHSGHYTSGRSVAPVRGRSLTTEPPLVRWLLIGVAVAFLRCFCCCRWWRCFGRRSRRASTPTSPPWPIPTPLSAIRLTLLTAARVRAAGHGLRRRRGLDRLQIRFRRQEPVDHADRPAVFRLAGDRRADFRAPVRLRAGLSGRGWRRTASRSSSPCPASSWPRCS